MLLESLEVKGFRNLREQIECSEGLNVFIGDNGQGKTNWLEAINVLATARSFRTSKLSETIMFGEDLAIVRGRIKHAEDIHRDLQVSIQGNTKLIAVNGKKEALQAYLGQLHAVSFTAEDMETIRGVPEGRRSFLDSGIVSLHPPFVQTLLDYGRVIRQKNSLLQQAREQGYSVSKTMESLEPWHEQLIMLAARIHKARLRYVERLNESLERRLFGGEEVSIRYLSSLEGKGDLDDYAGLLNQRLGLRAQAELAAGYALLGTHRDDLEIKFDGHDLRKFGSAGQQRSGFLILQLAAIELFHSTRGEYPLFLLDDLDAELDYHRIGKLLEYLGGKIQAFVTTSKQNFVEKFGQSAKVFDIENGGAKSR